MDTSSAMEDFDYIFESMALPHAFMDRAHAWFDKLRATRRRILAGELYAAEAKCVSIFADTQAGKSTIIRDYVARKVVDECYELGLFPKDTPRNVVAKLQRKVIHISVSGTSTLMSLLEDILRAFGDPRPEAGQLGPKKQRILVFLREFETELLVFDEMNHLQIGSSSSTRHQEATRVHNTLKDFLLGGCPIVFTGTAEAEKKVFSDMQIRSRCRKRLFIGPLVLTKKDHYRAYREYCGLLGLELVKLGLLTKRSIFIQKDTLICLFQASGGFLGHTTNIVQLATRFAIEEGADCVEWRHLSEASGEYTIFNRLQTYNPFERYEAERTKATLVSVRVPEDRAGA